MILDLIDPSCPDAIDADVCIIGAGPVGLTLALSLGRQGVRTLLLEAGGRSIELAAQSLYETTTSIGRRFGGASAGRCVSFGGTSQLWGGQILEMQKIDFLHRVWIPDSGWPFQKCDLQPYYTSALEYEGLGPTATMSTASGAQLKIWPANAADDILLHHSRWCPQPNFAHLHGKEVEQSANLTCVLHATLCRFEVELNIVTVAMAKSPTGRLLSVRARRFVVCCGAIESARMLLQPLSDGTSGPWIKADLPVGQYFQDHPTFECADVIAHRNFALHDVFDMLWFGGFKFQPRMHLSTRRQTEDKIPNVGGFLLFKSKEAAVVSEFRIAAKAVLGRPTLSSITRLAMTLQKGRSFAARQAWRYAMYRRSYNPDDLGIRLLCSVEQPPRAASRIRLATGSDSMGIIQAEVDWRLDRDELKAVRSFALATKNALQQMRLAEVRIEPRVEQLDDAFLGRGWDNYHHIGTTRMSRIPGKGVVDPDLRVFHTRNLYVCGSAVFPTGSFSNPTHTAIALALRLSDHLARVS